MSLTGKTELVGEKPVPVPLFPPETFDGHLRSNAGLRSETLKISLRSHGTERLSW
jgi:hypothetical protein